MREFLRGCPKKQGIFQTKGAGICQPSLYTLGPLMGEMRIEHLQLLKTMNCSYAPPYRFYNFIIFNHDPQQKQGQHNAGPADIRLSRR